MMDIVDLRYLAAAANAGNFGRAAKSLGLDTSTISRRIGRLEDELGFALFERAKSGVHLTAGGQSLMGHVNRTLAEFDGVVRAAGETGSGQIGAKACGCHPSVSHWSACWRAGGSGTPMSRSP
jgi:DNA-binding transcriptional LysR family regulator